MIENEVVCPFCGSDAEKRKDVVEVKIPYLGLTKKITPKKKWFCPNCLRHFKNPALKEEFVYEEEENK